MGNEEYLNIIKNSFPSLKTFNIEGNLLTFYDEKTNYSYKTYLNNINLSSFNQSIFLLNPRDIYRIVYMYELLQKDTSNESELQFVKDYITKYLKLESERLNNLEVDENLVYNMEIPILLIDDPRPEVQQKIKNLKAKSIIESALNEHVVNSNKGGQALVLRTQYFKEDKNDRDLLDLSSKAGFTSFILVLITIVFTIIYIALFLNK